jgi:hypothetical protein
MTMRPSDEPSSTEPADEEDLPWVSVRPDNGPSRSLLIKGSPLIAIGALRIGLMMARGRGTSAGSGPKGLVIGLLAVLFPLLWVVLLNGLRWANAGIRLEDGVLTVRDRWNRRVLHAPVASVTGVHTVKAPFDGSHNSRIVITSRSHRPVLVDPRRWDADGLHRLWQGLGLSFQDHGFLTGPLLRKRFPGIALPWRHVHLAVSTLLIVLGCIAYIALIVNLPFLL